MTIPISDAAYAGALSGHGSRSGGGWGDRDAWAAAHGFNVPREQRGHGRYPALTAEWRSRVQARRSA